MNTKKLILMTMSFCVLFVASTALAHWDESMPYKWVQYPDLEPFISIDVDATADMMGMEPPQLLADDFPCEVTGPITDIHIWGSWYHDYENYLVDPMAVVFTLSIHTDLPVGHPDNPYDWSMPGEVLWWRQFGPGEFEVEPYAEIFYEGYYNPCQGWYDPYGDIWCWLYNFYLEPGEFRQEGTPDEPVIYWLDVQAQPQPPNPPEARFGWKTSYEHFEDDAVWAVAMEPVPVPGPWQPLIYPPGHEYEGMTIDLAFVITGKEVEPDKDFGDAPEDGVAYPSTGVNGAFPTCMTCGVATWIQHGLGWAHFVMPGAPQLPWDPESDGDAGLCPPPGCFPTYDDDECFMDGDAGLMFPEPYTIDTTGNVVPCPTCTGTALGNTCQTAVWGANVDIWIVNNMPVDGYVNVLMDWDQNGAWAGSSMCPTAATPEHVLVNWPVPMGYAGPLSGLAPPNFLIGPNAGYVWTRFTITERPVPVSFPGWDGSGSFEDGETEDYLLLVEEKEPKPERLKWSQPPIERWPDPCNINPPYYCGWDEPSWTQYGPPFIAWPPRVADDFRCIGSGPVTSIHWWGSHVEWGGQRPPELQPIAWQFTFFSNIPADPTADPNFSEPGDGLWWFTVDANRVHPEFAGWDEFIDNPITESCFQYYVDLEPNEYFWQDEFDANTIDHIFWLSIEAVYPNNVDVVYPWGWKTRPWSWMDDAVKRKIIYPPMGLPYWVWDPIKAYGESYDAAFELDTDPNFIKWEQAFTGIRDWPHYEDELSMATMETIVEPITKWIQEPDLSNEGMDVDATMWETWKPQLLADDFLCEWSGPIDRIHIWGSWYHDLPPYWDANNVTFTLSIHEDLPVGHPDNPNRYSMPGKVLWMQTFWPGEFEVFPYEEGLHEGWYVPCAEPPYYDPFADTICWLYMFPINPFEAFWQEEGKIYWLDAQAKPIPWPDCPEPVRFGWKNTPEYYHWNDDAVWAVGTEDDHGPWNEMRYPVGHPYGGLTVDLAFELFTYGMTKWMQPPDLDYATSIDIDATKEEIWQPQVLADDFECTSTDPITDIHIWGSWYHDMVPMEGPEAVAFTLSIHADLPIGDPCNPYDYSIPGELLWIREFQPYEFVAWEYAWYLNEAWYVPCAEPPYYEPSADSICWQYDFYIDESEAFVQEGSPDEPVIYWLDVQARPVLLGPGAPPMRARFGWKTTPDWYHWNDDAVWAVGDEQEHGPWQELRHPETGETLDLAFEITSEREYEEFVIHRLVADDWRCDSNTPITAIVWWGSYIDYLYEACYQSEPMPLPVKPDYFLLNIWTDTPEDDPANPYPYSHPNDIIWEYKAYEYDEVLVGYDKHPEDLTGPPREPVFRYSVRIEDPNWFYQEDINDIYWLSVVAVYDGSVQNYDWGWTNHEHMYNDNAVEGYPTAAAPDEWVWNPLYDQTGMSEDMSFILFTAECMKHTAPEYANWVYWGKPKCWCYARQCRGDADGKKTVFYWVAIPDLTLFKAAFNKIESAMPPGGECCDFDHQKTLFYWVAIPDLTILKQYFNKMEPLVPECDQLPIYTGPYNFWTSP